MFHRCDDHGENLSLTRRTFNITQKISICKFNYTKNIYLFCYGNGDMRIAGGRKIYRWGMPGFLMATVVCERRGRGACMRFVGTVRFMRGVWVRPSSP